MSRSPRWKSPFDLIEGLDEAQKLAAKTEATAVVTAGAGAGKTRTLVGRYLHLVLEKNIPPESIVALTFTRKAAAEMATRLHEALTDCEKPMPDIAERLAQSHIQTLDSFCREIVAASAVRYGYTPEFAIDEELCRELAEKTAHRYVLAHMDEPGLSTLMDAFGFEDIVHHLFASFGIANIAPHWLGRHFCMASFQLAEAEFRRTGREVIDEASALVNELLACAASGQRSDFREGTRQAVALAGRLAETLQQVTDRDPPDYRPLKDFVELFRDPSWKVDLKKVARSDPAEQRIKELFQALFRDETRQGREKRQFIRKFSELADFECFLPEYREVMNHLDRYADTLCEEKRRANVMDFKDLGLLAEDILKQDDEVRKEWARRFSHILIDEFQDNNSLQKRILMLLSLKEHPRNSSDIEEGKLFFVGDEKQSIYLFRGADVSVFRLLADELGAAPMRLERNYRSSKKLIHFFNKAFAHILQPEDPESPCSFEAVYAPMEAPAEPLAPAAPAEPGAAEFPSRIEYHLVSGLLAEEHLSESLQTEEQGIFLDRDESQAFRIAQWIRDALESPNPLMVRRDKVPVPAGYGDIAILMRSSSKQYLLEKYLRMLGIPFIAEAGSALFSEQPANDLYYMLRLLLDDQDLYATAAVLRSPLCRISNEGYVSILARRLSLGDIQRELASGSEVLKSLSENDIEALKRLSALYGELGIRADHMPLMDLVNLMWDRGYLGLFLVSDPQRHPYLDHWHALRALASKVESEGGGISHLCEALRNYMQGRRTFDTGRMPHAREEGVRLMTVHKSKGLEFPVVIIPWMESQAGGFAQDYWGVLDVPETARAMALPQGYPAPQCFTVDIGFHDRQDGGSNFLQTHARTLREKKEKAETRRLLYVACTRAIDHLVFFGSEPPRNFASDSFHRYLFDSTDTAFLDPAARTGGTAKLPEHLESLQLVVHPLATDAEVSSASRQNVRLHSEALDIAKIAREYELAEVLDLSRPSQRIAVSELDPEAPPHIRMHTEEVFKPAIMPDKLAAAESPPNSSPDPALFGTLVHELFEFLVSGRPLERYRPSESIARGLAPFPDIVEKACELLKPLLESPFWRQASEGRTPRPEFPFLLSAGRFTLEGRMDMLLEGPETILILDLKTDRQIVPARHAAQLAVYRYAAKLLYPGRTVKAGLLYLFAGLVSSIEGEVGESDLLSWCKARRTS